MIIPANECGPPSICDQIGIEAREGVAAMRPFLFLLALTGVLIFSVPAGADSSDWMASVFPDRAHDFGNVAKGSQIRYAFPVVNRSNLEVHIADWRTKCGCTNVKVGTAPSLLAPRRRSKRRSTPRAFKAARTRG